jgi:hypothetical protein
MLLQMSKRTDRVDIRDTALSAAAPEVVKAVEAGRLRAHLKLGTS